MSANLSIDTLINRAYRLINVRSDDRDLTGGQVTEGLDCLNVLIDELSGIGIYVPTFSIYDFNLVQGQKDYDFSEILNDFTITELLYVSIIEHNVLYEVDVISDSLYFERNYLTSSGRPKMCYLDKFPDKSTIIFYQTPDKNYDCQLKGKFNIKNQAHYSNLDGIPPYMFFYLEYALGRMLHSRYPSSNWSDICEDYYKKSREDMIASNPNNFDLETTSVFRSKRYVTDLLSLT